MPIPKPKKDETQKDFIDRCMSDKIMMTDYTKNKQRYAVCLTSWEDSKEKNDNNNNNNNNKDSRSEDNMAVTLNSKGNTHAKSLIGSGDVDKSNAWSISADDENKWLGSNGDDWTTYSSWHLGVDSGEGENTKAHYKYPFGKNGKVYRSAVIAIKQRAAQQKATEVYNAASKLLVSIDGDKTNALPLNIERRYFPASELRVLDEPSPKISGYAAVFNKRSDNLGWGDWAVYEEISPGAFKNALSRSDARALFNHDANYVLGRESAGTLTLKEDATGLHMEVIPPDTQLGRDLLVSIKRGDITQQSFGFTIATDSWREDQKNKIAYRTIEEVGELYDVSPVTFPAYPDTSVALRSLESARTSGAIKEIEEERIEIPNKESKNLKQIFSDEIDADYDRWFDILQRSCSDPTTISDEDRFYIYCVNVTLEKRFSTEISPESPVVAPDGDITGTVDTRSQELINKLKSTYIKIGDI